MRGSNGLETNEILVEHTDALAAEGTRSRISDIGGHLLTISQPNWNEGMWEKQMLAKHYVLLLLFYS